jgi:hypothetical protein
MMPEDSGEPSGRPLFQSTKRAGKIPEAVSASSQKREVAAADDGDVVAAAHEGSCSPDRSATMYAAYQSGQFASCGRVRFSCSPCAARRTGAFESNTRPSVQRLIRRLPRSSPGHDDFKEFSAPYSQHSWLNRTAVNAPHVELLRTDAQGLDRRDQTDFFRGHNGTGTA